MTTRSSSRPESYMYSCLAKMDSCIAFDIARAMFERLSRLIFAATLATTVSITAQNLSSANGVYDTSTTPSNLPWNTYNYCNAPHVNTEHYTLPDINGAKLVYINAVIRHHKVRRSNFHDGSLTVCYREHRIICILLKIL